MRLTALLLFITQIAFGQTQPKDRVFQFQEVFKRQDKPDSFGIVNMTTHVITIDHDGQITRRDTKTDTATLYLPSDGKTHYVATMTWKKQETMDTVLTKTVIESTDVSVQKTNMTSVTGSAKPDISGQSFIYVTNTSQIGTVAYNFTITGVAGYVEVFSERYQGHCNVAFVLDALPGMQMDQGAPPFGTDYKRGQATFRAKVGPGAHRIVLQPYPSPGQYTIDFIRITNATLVPHVP